MKMENPVRLEQEEKAEEKRLAIMMMKKKEKYLYDKIMFGKKRKIREVHFIFFYLNKCPVLRKDNISTYFSLFTQVSVLFFFI